VSGVSFTTPGLLSNRATIQSSCLGTLSFLKLRKTSTTYPEHSENFQNIQNNSPPGGLACWVPQLSYKKCLQNSGLCPVLLLPKYLRIIKTTWDSCAIKKETPETMFPDMFLHILSNYQYDVNASLRYFEIDLNCTSVTCHKDARVLRMCSLKQLAFLDSITFPPPHPNRLWDKALVGQRAGDVDGENATLSD